MIDSLIITDILWSDPAETQQKYHLNKKAVFWTHTLSLCIVREYKKQETYRIWDLEDFLFFSSFISSKFPLLTFILVRLALTATRARLSKAWLFENYKCSYLDPYIAGWLENSKFPMAAFISVDWVIPQQHLVRYASIHAMGSKENEKWLF